MSSVSVFASGDGWGHITWEVHLSEPKKLHGSWRAYRGLRVYGQKNESLLCVLEQAMLMHKANMLICGRVETPVTQIIFFDPFGRVIKTPAAIKELCLNK